jgi:hypothetical protein
VEFTAGRTGFCCRNPILGVYKGGSQEIRVVFWKQIPACAGMTGYASPPAPSPNGGMVRDKDLLFGEGDDYVKRGLTPPSLTPPGMDSGLRRNDEGDGGIASVVALSRNDRGQKDTLTPALSLQGRGGTRIGVLPTEG